MVSGQKSRKRKLITAPTLADPTSQRRLGPIYLRDLFQLVKTPGCDKLRRVSRAANATFTNSPPHVLPRRLFHSLEIVVAEPQLTRDGRVSRNNPVLQQKNGWVKRSTNPPVIWFRAHRDDDDERCCQELEPFASQLVDELIFPEKSANTTVQMRVWESGRVKRLKTETGYRSRFLGFNRLTEATARDLLRFMAHSGGGEVAFKYTTTRFVADRFREMNPRILAAFREAAGYAHEWLGSELWMPGTSLAGMRGRLQVLRFSAFNTHFTARTNLNVMLHVLTKSGGLVVGGKRKFKEVRLTYQSFHGWQTGGKRDKIDTATVDSIVEFFQSEVALLSNVVPVMKFFFASIDGGWPTTLRDKLTTTVESGWPTRTNHMYSIENTHSGKRFAVALIEEDGVAKEMMLRFT